MAAHALDQVGAADGEARLRSAEKLVARERDDVRARLDAGAGGRLVERLDERAGAEVVHEREPVPVGEPREIADARDAR